MFLVCRLNTMSFEKWEFDGLVDELVSEYDETIMPLPDIESEPHLLISKVRKHYMEYMIRLLSINYETNQRLLNKNIYLPSAIWRCAKAIEMTAVQACMVVQLYRRNITTVIKQLQDDTKKGKMFKKLSECLNKPPANEKKTQASMQSPVDCKCQCVSVKRKRKLKMPTLQKCENIQTDRVISDDQNIFNEQYKIPVTINLHSEPAQALTSNETVTCSFQDFSFIPPKQQPKVSNQPMISTPKTMTPVENQDSDELMMQLEKLFQGDPNDDDIFEGALCDTLEADTTTSNIASDPTKKVSENSAQNSVIENHAAQIKSLDERLATLAGLLVNNNDSTVVANEPIPEQKSETPKNKKYNSSKWLCEEYFLKQRLYDLLDQIGDSNRKDLERIKEKFIYLFGSDSDDEGVLSPLDESAEFVISCKERIAPWVVKLLTPYYIKGRIRGKALFKSLAKHLIRLIYQCSKYPQEYEVSSFVLDFLENHKMIRCEADFKQFRIDNI